MVAGQEHLRYVSTINDTIDEAAKARGTGIARRTDEYITDKINQGKAIIALNREEFVKFITNKVNTARAIKAARADSKEKGE